MESTPQIHQHAQRSKVIMRRSIYRGVATPLAMKNLHMYSFVQSGVSLHSGILHIANSISQLQVQTISHISHIKHIVSSRNCEAAAIEWHQGQPLQ